jgi:chitin disaccharide deacetylase
VTRLVINADDFGFDAAIDRGILKAHRDGIVTSASLLVTGRSARVAVQEARAQDLALGVHLCLTSSLVPASNPSTVPSLAPRGRFRKSWREVLGVWMGQQLDVEEIAAEFRSQVALARELGAAPDHLDAHQHLHLLPGVAEVVQAISEEFSLPVRWPREAPKLDWLFKPGPGFKSLLLSGLSHLLTGPAQKVAGVGLFEAGGLDEDALFRLLLELPEGDFELGCHPGSQVEAMPEEPEWKYNWDEELAALCSPRIRQVVQARGIHLCTYRELFP